MTHSKSQRHKTCVYSGEDTHGKEVVITKYAIEYVKKMGYGVTKFLIHEDETQ